MLKGRRRWRSRRGIGRFGKMVESFIINVLLNLEATHISKHGLM